MNGVPDGGTLLRSRRNDRLYQAYQLFAFCLLGRVALTGGFRVETLAVSPIRTASFTKKEEPWSNSSCRNCLAAKT